MSRDLLGMLAAWQRAFGDVVHVRIRPEHQIIVTDPQLARNCWSRITTLIRWERGMRVFAQLHGNSVLIAEGDAWRGQAARLAAELLAEGSTGLRTDHRWRPAGQALVHWPDSAGNWPIRERAHVAGNGCDHADGVLERDRRARPHRGASLAHGHGGGQRRVLLARELARLGTLEARQAASSWRRSMA
ncbi:hypothetical protein ACU4GD_30240 [Cupriavidus basilensis]